MSRASVHSLVRNRSLNAGSTSCTSAATRSGMGRKGAGREKVSRWLMRRSSRSTSFEDRLELLAGGRRTRVTQHQLG